MTGWSKRPGPVTGDAEATLTYEWGLSGQPEFDSEVSQKPIEVLALCCGAHWIDESEVVRCGSCAFDLCRACGDDAVLANCPVCYVPSCGLCRKETGGLCLRCGSPERAAELDTQFAVGWQLNIGHGSARWRAHGGGEAPEAGTPHPSWFVTKTLLIGIEAVYGPMQFGTDCRLTVG